MCVTHHTGLALPVGILGGLAVSSLPLCPGVTPSAAYDCRCLLPRDTPSVRIISPGCTASVTTEGPGVELSQSAALASFQLPAATEEPGGQGPAYWGGAMGAEHGGELGAMAGTPGCSHQAP